ncbi:hypothetical protein NCG89_13565 [Spongiibacter taiwanensis]|uniref:hypothetical protein n=1 Tax=Spongiibacter taiwanensis TaxID=1748242 RepID=UPI0020353FAF|nr:hypothetical protein [Spongiibacter taiwanensis]USA42556.1 hypothetical protein NCG89_13565 [Spongiibacter taiwanensis]
MKKITGLSTAAALASLSLSAIAQTPLNSLNGLLADPAGANYVSIDNLMALPNDFTRSFENVSLAVPGLIAFGSNANPFGSLEAVSGIGGSLGVGIVTGIVPVTTILLDPSLAPTFFENSGIISNFGFLGEFPAIPLVNSGIGELGLGGMIPGGAGLGLLSLDGFSGLDVLLGGGFDGLILPLDPLSL